MGFFCLSDLLLHTTCTSRIQTKMRGVRDEVTVNGGGWGTCDMRKIEEEITEMKRYECLVVQLICRGLNEGRIDRYRRTLCPMKKKQVRGWKRKEPKLLKQALHRILMRPEQVSLRDRPSTLWASWTPISKRRKKKRASASAPVWACDYSTQITGGELNGEI